VLEDLRRGRPFGHEAELKMFDDFIDGIMVFNKGYDAHLASP